MVQYRFPDAVTDRRNAVRLFQAHRKWQSRVILGQPGTNGQHSFYQLLHQGTDIVPLQFVGFKNNQLDTDVVIQDSTSQQKLCANVAAQIVAFACGKEDENRNKNFEGGRPSSIIIGEQVNPKTLGALLAHFENKIMFQGFLWNVNSFDQEGVQLGKVLAKRVLAHAPFPLSSMLLGKQIAVYPRHTQLPEKQLMYTFPSAMIISFFCSLEVELTVPLPPTARRPPTPTYP